MDLYTRSPIGVEDAITPKISPSMTRISLGNIVSLSEKEDLDATWKLEVKDLNKGF